MRRPVRVAAWLIGLTFCLPAGGCGQDRPLPLPCDGTFYLSHAPHENDPSTLLRIYYEGASGSWRFDTLAGNIGRRIDPMGFRTRDNLLYGLDPRRWEIVSVDAGGTLRTVGSVAEQIDTTLDYYAGAITPSGSRFFIMGRDRQTGLDKKLFSIRLDSPTLRVSAQNVLSDQGVRIEDMAFHPIYGDLRGFDSRSQKILSVNWLFGRVEELPGSSFSKLEALSAMFYDQAGDLYGYGRKPGSGQRDSKLVQIGRSSRAVQFLADGPGSKFTDGCSCPYSIQLSPRYTPEVARPCDTLRVTYRMDNRGGTSFLNISFTDTLAPHIQGWQFVHLPRSAQPVPHTDARVVEIAFTDFLLGKDSLVIDLLLDENSTGTFSQGGWLGRFPFRLDTLVEGGKAGEQVPTYQVSNLSLSLPDTLDLCQGQQQTLVAEVCPGAEGTEVVWETGAIGPMLAVDQPGWYRATVLSACQSATDSVFVRIPDSPFAVEAGPDQTLLWGESLRLSFSTNRDPLRLWRWAADPGIRIDCDTCLSPTLYPEETGKVWLQAIDASGCLATDTVSLTVDRETELLAPNVITPNGDGINDWFYFSGRGLITVEALTIYDRWGKKIFEGGESQINAPLSGWNGQNTNAPHSVYFWTATLVWPDQSRQTRQGSFLLMK